MKTVRLAAVSLSVSCLILSLATTIARARVAFDQMPAGCNWVTHYSNGNVWRDTFTGKQGRFYIVETTDAKNGAKHVKQTRYDLEGRMVYRDWGGGKWEKFKPFSCYDEMGTCTYRFSNADGANLKIVNTKTKSGEGYLIRAGVPGGETFNDDHVFYGPFNLSVRQWSKNFSDTTGDFRQCGSGIS